MPSMATLLRSVCWSGLVLSTVYAWAAPDAASPQPAPVPLADHGQPALAPTSGRQDTVAQAGSPPAVEAPASEALTLVALADPSLAATATQREQLHYLVRCALPAGLGVYAEQDGTRFTFPGGLGLAPGWVDAAMTPSEERWVSACLLAHLNAFGKHVTISLRATPPPAPALTASDEEAQRYTIFEGGFFGNLFAPQPVAYTCQGARTPSQARDPILHDRVCTQATGDTTAAGTPITACRLLLTGRCEEPGSTTVEGTHYAEVIFVYLHPSPPVPSGGATPPSWASGVVFVPLP